MNSLIQSIADHAGMLSGQDFKMLMIMAIGAENNPPTYSRGRDYVTEKMGWARGSNAANKNFEKRIRQLVDMGFLSRVHRGGFYEFAQYEFVFPTPDKGE